MTDRQTERNTGIDALRILAVYMVILVHIIGKGGIWTVANQSYLKECGISFLYSFACCGVNCFGLISGYVGYQPKIDFNLGRYLSLWLEVVFYGAIGIIAIMLFNQQNFSAKDFVDAFLPITRGRYWYYTAYSMLFFLMPFINRITESFDNNTTIKACLVAVILLSFYNTAAANLGGDPFELKEGYSFVWLSFLYFVGASFKKYDWAANIIKQYSKKVVVFLGLGLVVLSVLWHLIAKNVLPMFIGFSWGENILFSYTAPTTLIISICLLILFVCQKYSKNALSIINYCAPTTFGVYVIHEHPFFRQLFVRGKFTNFTSLPTIFLLIAILAVALLILLIGIIIDRMRIRLFQVLHVRRLAELANAWVCSKVDRILKKILMNTFVP